MVQKNQRRTDQEWFNLIQECRVSGLSDKDWCEQHHIPISSFYTKVSRLRKKACPIPDVQKQPTHKPQQVVPLQVIEDDLPSNRQGEPFIMDSFSAITLKIHDYSIQISNHATKETILNTILALQQLC